MIPTIAVTLFYNDAGEVSDLVEAGFDRAVSEFEFIAQEVDVRGLGDDTLVDDVATGQQVVIDWTLETDVDSVARRASRHLVHRPRSVGHRPERHVDSVRRQRGSYLAGAAAALRSSTGVVGFIGGVDMDDDLAVRGRLRGRCPCD